MTKFCLSAVAVALAFAAGASRLSAQAVATATGNALAVGVTYQNANPDYGPIRASGLGIFADYDFSRYLGVTAELNLPTAFSSVVFLEHSYLFGVRGEYHYKRYMPYAKVLIGGATSSNNTSNPNLINAPGSFPMYAYGGGFEIRLPRHLTVRAIDFEQQRWFDYQPHGLTPTIVSFGAAYRFQ